MTRRILITGARAPAALHLARLLVAAGHHVVMADSVRFPIGAVSRACRSYVRLPAANGPSEIYGSAVAQALTDHAIDLVIPTCEEGFHLAHVWAGRPMQASLFAPDLSALLSAHNKFTFAELVASLGLNAPETRLLERSDDLNTLDKPTQDLVFKPVWSRFATQVAIRPLQVSIRPTATAPWVAQDFVSGDEVCAYAVAVKGTLVALSAYRPTHRAGRGAAIGFVRDDDIAIKDFVQAFVKGTGWHGQVSFDFIRRPDGTIFAIECNPRATSGIHFFDTSSGFVAAALSGVPAAPTVTTPLGVKAALAIYGSFQRPRAIWKEIAQMQDVVAWPGDPRPARSQFLATLEFAAIALRHRIGLTAATTHDIAWNGDHS